MMFAFCPVLYGRVRWRVLYLIRVGGISCEGESLFPLIWYSMPGEKINPQHWMQSIWRAFSRSFCSVNIGSCWQTIDVESRHVLRRKEIECQTSETKSYITLPLNFIFNKNYINFCSNFGNDCIILPSFYLKL